MINKVSWQTVAATNDAGSRAAASALANRLAAAWKESSQVTADYRYSRMKRPDYWDQKFSQN
jgi:hypothetical protein